MSEVNRDETDPVATGLFDRLAAGDESAVEDLLIHFKDCLRGLTKQRFDRERRLPDLHQADDIEQGVALRLFQALQRVKPTTTLHFIRLARVCVRNELAGLARKEYGAHGDRGRLFANLLGRSDAIDELDVGDSVGGSSGAVPLTYPEIFEATKKAREILLELPEQEREVFKLIQDGGLTHKAVAAELGVSEATVKRRWNHALATLRAKLQGDVADR